MIKEIRYKNFKALRDTTLPLGRFTLIVGANGTGKSTALKALEVAKNPKSFFWEELVSSGVYGQVFLGFYELTLNHFGTAEIQWGDGQDTRGNLVTKNISDLQSHSLAISNIFRYFQIFSFDAEKISQTVHINSNKELQADGGNLAGILDLLKDTEPERWKELNDELENWFPEFDQILFDRTDEGKYIVLRTKFGKHKIKAKDLSDGTLLALAYLTLAYLPNPPKIVAFEEPEKGIHPRLLRNIQEAMDRLAYPENFGEKREPIQVIATTHSPYLLDLYKDRKDEIVIADKDENGVHFQRLSEMKNIDKILEGGEALGEVWFTGVLGGVPAHI